MAAVPKISVVVPVYNVQDFLEPCLESLVAQTVDDFEVVLVDDGSTDGSVAIAEEFAGRDGRFRIVSQENGGLSKARNTGMAAAEGEYLAFLDSDDVLPANAYALLLGALEKTGSDFATGNVHRLTRFGTVQSPFLARAFAETRMKTHVTKYRPLIADRTAWNKLWRRSFWDRHGFRFPEGRLFEDSPVTVPAHFLASSVDVIADPVYHWRIREDGELSITQRRLDPRSLRDRMTAIEEVSEQLAAKGPRGAKRWYDESVVADDLRYYVNALEGADDEYLALFMDRVNAFLDRASDRIFKPLPAIERLKWHLVRRRLVPELLEVLRFQKQDLGRTPPVRVRGKWYGDYPFRTDTRLRVPRSVYRLKGELWVRAGLDGLRQVGDKLELSGHAYITGIGAASEDGQRVSLSVLRPGRLRRIRLRITAVRLRTRTTHRPDVAANARQALCDLSWCGFEATLDPRDLRRLGRPADGKWELYVTVLAGGVRRRRSRFSVDAPWPVRSAQVGGLRAAVSEDGEVTLDVRKRHKAPAPVPPPVVTGAHWTEDGALELSGELPAGGAWHELVLAEEENGYRHAFALDAADGAFTATLTPARIESLAGPLPLPRADWLLYADDVPVAVARELYDRLPLETVVDHKPFAFGVAPGGDQAVLVVRQDLDEDERGGFNQRRLRETAYASGRGAPLRDAVVYNSFLGRQYSDSPRAIHEELVRRDAPLEHLWVVRDGRCRVPETARVVREGSREYHEAMARARYVVANDHFPDWFVRRPDQLCLQTWHGTPLKRLGLDVSDMRKTVRRFQRRWEQQIANWQYVLSPNRFATPILRQAYAIEGEMLETGYPRVDALARADRDEAGRRLRHRLDLPDGARVVLYAPTYRDQVVDRRGRFRLDLQLDLERLRAAVGDDTVILFRKHHYIADAVPATADGFVRDVSSFPDGTELMLAADVLITDYSSMMVDFANTGRPMLFYTYDLDAYADEIRGFYLDFVETVPGPLLRTTDEVADALRDLDTVRAAYAERYAAFRARFCELDDGRAAERVVDRLF
jgi:CDP-glycerol glycerophosphotransferase (TagB/SpsB family)/glycosyltransferase involved in cell wall biosynthesis